MIDDGRPASGDAESDEERIADARSRVASGGLGSVIEAGLSGQGASARGVLDAIGGWRGVAESLLPATVYLICFVVTQQARLSVIAPLVLAAAAILWRLVRKEPLSAAFSGVVGVVVCAAAVLFSGEGSSYFVPGFYINAAWILAHAVSLLIGWPLIGLALGFLRGSLTAWRAEPSLRRAVRLTTLVWIAIFALRLAVQLPLFFSGSTEALGIARLVMGVPLFALAILFTWLVLSRVSAVVDAVASGGSGRDRTGDAGEDPQTSDE